MTIWAAFLPALLVAGLCYMAMPWIPAESRAVRRLFFVIYCLLQVQYLVWRVVSTLPAPAWSVGFVYALMFLPLEILLAYSGYCSQRALLRTTSRHAEADANEGWFLALPGAPPMIDVLIPTYNEPWEILEKTIVGARAQDYPRFRVWILDDGRRPWLEQAAGREGVGYLTRADNQAAKAGNLNNALARLERLSPPPDFVAVLDADFIPRPRFLSRAMTLMADQSRGIVQTPQYHLNPDPFQTAFKAWKKWPDTQRFLFNVTLPSQDAVGGAFCCGTSFLARMEALRAIGGFPTEAVTEDVLTTLKMLMKGWKTVYLRELLSTGLAPEGLHEYLTQRGRWSLGSVQIGWWCASQLPPGAGLLARCRAMDPFLKWGYMSLLRVVVMAVPLIYWLFGLAPYQAKAWEVFWFAIPTVVLQRFFMSWLSRGGQLPIIAPANVLLSSFAVVPAMFKGLLDRGNHRFVVTDKGQSHGGVLIHWGPLRWLLGYGAALAAAMIYRFNAPGGSGLQGAFKFIAVIWTLSNLLDLVVAALLCVESPRRRLEYRYPADEAAGLSTSSGISTARLLDVSIAGALIQTAAAELDVGCQIEVALESVGPVRAQVVRSAGRQRWGLRFETTIQQKQALIRKVFCQERYVQPADDGSTMAVVSGLLRRLFT
jgi:cellulose synthase (UDP-forming)